MSIFEAQFQSKMLPIKKDIKLVKSLSQKKFRNELGLFLVEGKKMVEEALHSDFEIHSLYSTDEEWIIKHPYGMHVSRKEMDQMSGLSTPSSHLLVLRQTEIAPKHPISSLQLFLDGVSDPGNLGTIIRTAEWFGINSIICSEDCVELFNPKVVQSTMGSMFRMRVVSTDLPLYAEKFIADGGIIYGADLQGENALHETFESKSALVIGSESHGIRPNMHRLISKKLYIPGNGKAESLNAAIAASILMAQWFRHSS